MSQSSDEELMSQLAGSTEEEESAEPDLGRFKLRTPIEIKGREIDSVRVTEPNVSHILSVRQAIGKKPTLASVTYSQFVLLSKAADLSIEVVKELPTSIIDRAVSYAADFEDKAWAAAGEWVARGIDSMPLEKVITVKKPLSGGGKDFSEMRLSEATGSIKLDFESRLDGASDESLFRAQIHLLQVVSGWHPAAVMRLPISKFVEGVGYISAFFSDGQRNGNRSSLI